MRFSEFVRQIEDCDIVIYKDFTCVRNESGFYDTCKWDNDLRKPLVITFHTIEHAYNRMVREYKLKSSI